MGLETFSATQIPMNPIFAIHVGMGWPPIFAALAVDPCAAVIVGDGIEHGIAGTQAAGLHGIMRAEIDGRAIL